jgi:hypothetical protein
MVFNVGISTTISIANNVLKIKIIVKLLTSISFKIWVAHRVDEMNLHRNHYKHFESR